MRELRWLIGLLLLVPVACAEESGTLDDALAQAVAHSPEIVIAQANVAEADAKLRVARWGFFHPELRVYAGDNALTGTTKAGVQVSQDLMRLLTLNRDEVRQADRDLTIAREHLAIARQQTTHQVVEAWGRLRLTEDAVRLNAGAVADQEKLLAFTRAQFDAGAGTLDQLLTAQQALVRAQHALRQADNEQWQARVALSQLLGELLPTSGVSP